MRRHDVNLQMRILLANFSQRRQRQKISGIQKFRLFIRRLCAGGQVFEDGDGIAAAELGRGINGRFPNGFDRVGQIAKNRLQRLGIVFGL